MGLLRHRPRKIAHISVAPDWHFSRPVRTDWRTAIDSSHNVVEGELSLIPCSQGGEFGRSDVEKHNQRSVSLCLKSVTDRAGVAELGRREGGSIALGTERH